MQLELYINELSCTTNCEGSVKTSEGSEFLDISSALPCSWKMGPNTTREFPGFIERVKLIQ